MPRNESTAPGKPYRFGFVLTTAAGNKTRYLNLRKYADRDVEVECVWAPVSHYLEQSALPALPGPLRNRAIVSRQSRPVMSRIGDFDAVMFHVFEPYAWAAFRSLVHRRPALVWSQDNPPISRPETHPETRYGPDSARPAWRKRLRFLFDRWCISRTALFLPFSRWAADILTGDCGVPAARVHPIHVGIDLELWPAAPPANVSAGEIRRPVKLLFVGGDFERKGGDLLLEVFASGINEIASLTVVTNKAPERLPSGIVAHTGIQPDDPILRRLYAECDVFVLPTLADMSSWAALEAMATGRPVVISGVGGIPDLVEDGTTGFLIAPGDGGMLCDRLRTLIENAPLRHAMGRAGRNRVESRFDARICVAAILEQMKRTVDETGGSAKSRAAGMRSPHSTSRRRI